MPDAIGGAARHFMRELTAPVLGKAAARLAPRLIGGFAGNHAEPQANLSRAGQGRQWFQILRWFCVAEARGFQCCRRRRAGIRCPRQKQIRHQFRRQGGRQTQVGHLIISAAECDRLSAQQGLHDLGVFHQPIISCVMLCGVAQLL